MSDNDNVLLIVGGVVLIAVIAGLSVGGVMVENKTTEARQRCVEAGHSPEACKELHP